MRLQLFVLVLSSIFCFHADTVVASTSSSPGATSTVSPVRYWDASWAASCAQGTAIAMKCDGYILLFFQSPTSDVWKPPIMYTRDPPQVLSGLQVRLIDMPGRGIHFAPSWLALHNSVCGMTGLASDVEHISRILQRRVDGHFNVYTKPLTTFAMQKQVASVLRQAAQEKGGRPFGIQALFIGCDDISATSNKSEKKQQTCLYSIDPSGNWQSWGRATAIGKYAEQVRRQLGKNLSSKSSLTAKNGTNPNLSEALELILLSWKKACNEENVNSGRDLEKYEVLVLWMDDNTDSCRLAVVEDHALKEAVEKVEAMVE